VEFLHIALGMGKVSNSVVNIGLIDGKAFSNNSLEFVDHSVCIVDIFFVAHDGKVVPTNACSDIEVFFQVFYVFVAWAKKVSSYVGIVKG